MYIAGYIQDNWKVTEIDLNLGLRYDWMGRPHEYFGAEASLEIPVPASANICCPPIVTASYPGLYQPPRPGWNYLRSHQRADLAAMSYGDFGPRLGFAYHAARNLVVRGGYALFYGGTENEGLSARGSNAFPFVVLTSYSAANAVTPITPNNSVGTIENGLLNVPLASNSAPVSRGRSL